MSSKDETSVLETEIPRLQSEIEARVNQPKPDLNTSPAPEYHHHYQQHYYISFTFLHNRLHNFRVKNTLFHACVASITITPHNNVKRNSNSYRYKIKPLQILISHRFYWNWITFSQHQVKDRTKKICSKIPFLPASYSANSQLNMTILSIGVREASNKHTYFDVVSELISSLCLS
ncbi:unnamed protein product [Brassica oleracea]